MAKRTKLNLYWPPAVTVDLVIFTIEDDVLKVLLMKRSQKPFAGKWALPGGFLFKNETSAQAAQRILADKAGIKGGRGIYLEQLYTFDSIDRDPRGHVLTVSYFALIGRNRIKFFGNGGEYNLAFHKVENLPAVAFDHNLIVKYAVKRLRYKLEYTNVVYSLLPSTFTLGHLQDVHEIIFAKQLDKRNFRKKFLSLGLIKSVNKKLVGARQRPAQLYKFVYQNPTELKRFF